MRAEFLSGKGKTVAIGHIRITPADAFLIRLAMVSQRIAKVLKRLAPQITFSLF
jgi:hypothetical protein